MCIYFLYIIDSIDMLRNFKISEGIVLVQDYLDKIKDLLDHIAITDGKSERYEYSDGIDKIVEILKICKIQKGCLYICGNGGSAGIAQHMTADFLKNGGIRTYNMYGQSTITCISNDLTYEYVFCKQLEMLAECNDILIAISSSGESENIIRAIQEMRKVKGKVITFTGFLEENRIKRMGDINIYVPAERYGMVESIHNLILQQMVDEIVDTDGVAMKI